MLSWQEKLWSVQLCGCTYPHYTDIYRLCIVVYAPATPSYLDTVCSYLNGICVAD
jgi:hypothetical protein